jgi:hypothetical protein
MIEDAQYEDDPIIAALGLTPELAPVIPPVDRVFGYFQKVESKFRLIHGTLNLYMETDLDRILYKGPISGGKRPAPGPASALVLRADGNYPADVHTGRTMAESAQSSSDDTMTTALYAAYSYEKTTPWHEW